MSYAESPAIKLSPHGGESHIDAAFPPPVATNRRRPLLWLHFGLNCIYL
jgi:hypothetical protein